MLVSTYVRWCVELNIIRLSVIYVNKQDIFFAYLYWNVLSQTKNAFNQFFYIKFMLYLTMYKVQNAYRARQFLLN